MLILGRDNTATNVTQIYNSSNNGNVINNADDTSIRYVGGLIGRSQWDITIEKSFNTGDVSWGWDYENNTKTTEYIVQIVGGLVGTVWRGSVCADAFYGRAGRQDLRPCAGGANGTVRGFPCRTLASCGRYRSGDAE